MSLLALRGVSLGYDRQAVLEAVDLEIMRGEFVVVLGPNGGGKTTLFRGMLGLIAPLAGRVEWAIDRRAHPPGYVPQKDTLDPVFPLTAYDVVLMGTFAGLAPLRPVGRRRRRLAQRCLEQVGLPDVAERPYWALSGGQRQRVLIARALAVEPEVLLLDEPTAGIDPAAEAGIMDLLCGLHRERHLTVILVSHHLRALQGLDASVLWVAGGRVIRGAARELLAPARLAELFGATGLA